MIQESYLLATNKIPVYVVRRANTLITTRTPNDTIVTPAVAVAVVVVIGNFLGLVVQKTLLKIKLTIFLPEAPSNKFLLFVMLILRFINFTRRN